MARAGAFRDLATFERLGAAGVNDLGSPIPAEWTVIHRRKVMLRESTGRERIEAGALGDTAPAVMRLIAPYKRVMPV